MIAIYKDKNYCVMYTTSIMFLVNIVRINCISYFGQIVCVSEMMIIRQDA